MAIMGGAILYTLAALAFLGPPGTYRIFEDDGNWHYRYGYYNEHGFIPLVGPPYLPPPPPPKPYVPPSYFWPYA